MDANWSAIVDSADRPLDGRRWWLKAEKPWQCLAACFELRDALQYGTGALTYGTCALTNRYHCADAFT